MNGKVLMLAIIFLGGFHVFYAFNRVQNFANIMYRLCAIQLGECLKEKTKANQCTLGKSLYKFAGKERRKKLFPAPLLESD